MTEYALPSPPDVLGVDGVVVGRAVGFLADLAGTALSRTALKFLGDQYHGIGVSVLFSPTLLDTDWRCTFSPDYR